MFGVLVDVSGSMQGAYALDRSSDANVDRTHAIFTTIMNIVKREVVHHDRRESIFVCAFGLCEPTQNEMMLNMGEDFCLPPYRAGPKPPVTCDLVSLLEYIAGPKDSRGYQPLIDLAKRHQAPHAEPWIKKHLSELEAGILHRCLCSDTSLVQKLIELIPSSLTTTTKIALSLAARTGVEAALVHRSQAYKLAREIIENVQVPIVEQPEPRPVQDVSELLDYLLLSKAASSASAQSLHDRIKEFIERIKPYIYGGTPMCKALDAAVSVFKKTNASPKVLFLLSDGQSADGEPRPVAQQLRDLGVTIVTCFLTSDHIDNPRRLFDEADPNWRKSCEKGRLALFEMSSTMQNTHTPLSYLIDANWELPPSGVSHLFVQANSLDVVNEICEIVVSQMTKSCDALVHILEKVPLATYINQRNAEFEPKIQEGATCYANAIAAVFHLAMHRIVGREGGIPDFFNVRQRIIDEYGVGGAYTDKVLEKVCPEYRLHFRQVDETGARRAINERRPVVATFVLYAEQWTKFSAFYKKTPKGILNKSDVTGGPPTPGGHAVVLIRCNPDCLIFMNSYGQSFADGGFFRVKDQSVLNDTTFYDIYWTKNDLKPSEKEAYERECTKRAQELSQTFPSIQDLSYECPICNQNSYVGEFSGHLLEAKCPKCYQKFQPTNSGIMHSLYSRNI